MELVQARALRSFPSVSSLVKTISFTFCCIKLRYYIFVVVSINISQIHLHLVSIAAVVWARHAAKETSLHYAAYLTGSVRLQIYSKYKKKRKEKNEFSVAYCLDSALFILSQELSELMF